MALLSQIGPSGVSSTGTYIQKGREFVRLTWTRAPREASQNWQQKKEQKYITRPQNTSLCTCPRGLRLRNSGLLFVTPIWNDGASSSLTPTYSAETNALKAFLLLAGAWSTWNGSQAATSSGIRARTHTRSDHTMFVSQQRQKMP